ncbi:hypothetical protein GF324_07770 [bacterium]|nr:hypothetical protein [bacterium]
MRTRAKQKYSTPPGQKTQAFRSPVAESLFVLILCIQSPNSEDLMKVSHILYPTDFSETSARALDQAVVLAHRFNAKLTMLFVETPHGADPHNPNKEFPPLDELFAYLREQGDKRMDDADAPVVSGKIELEEQVVRDTSPAHGILSFADAYDVDMIVIGTHGRGQIAHFLLGSTAEKVVHGAKVPVLTVGRGEDRFLLNQGVYKRILIPMDFSEACRFSMKTSMEIARRFEADIAFVHVIEPVLNHEALMTGHTAPMQMDTQTEFRSRAALKRFAEDLLPDRYEFFLTSGVTHQEIIRVIQSFEADLIVVANKGWSPIERFLLGSTTEKLIRKSPVPVLVVRNPKAEEDQEEDNQPPGRQPKSR